MNNLSLISYHFIVKNKSFLLVQRKNSEAGRESFLRESQISIHSFENYQAQTTTPDK